MTAEILSFETGRPAELAEGEPALVVDVEGYEGPLDLLLALARQQKVDLAKISILALADQYLHFIEAARKIRLELAADYLVMAAWLAFLKSRLLLPEPPSAEGPSAEEMAKFEVDERFVRQAAHYRAIFRSFLERVPETGPLNRTLFLYMVQGRLDARLALLPRPNHAKTIPPETLAAE